MLASPTDNETQESMDDNALSACYTQAEVNNESDISLTNQTSPMELYNIDNLDNVENVMNTYFRCLRFKPDEYAEQDFLCKDSLYVYSNGSGAVGDADDACYVCKARGKDM